MDTKTFLFNENPVTFILGRNNSIMIDASQMAKPFEKRVIEFMSNETTKKFIAEILKEENMKILGIESESDLYVVRPNSGTWMHRILALKLAAWLDPAFELWVYSTIDNILFGKHVEREKSFERTLSFQKQIDELKEKPEKTGEDFENYLELEKHLKREKSIRKSLTAESMNGMKSMFEKEDFLTNGFSFFFLILL